MNHPKIDQILHYSLDCFLDFFTILAHKIWSHGIKPYFFLLHWIKFTEFFIDNLAQFKEASIAQLMFLKQIFDINFKIFIVFFTQFYRVTLIANILVSHNLRTKFMDLELSVVLVDDGKLLDCSKMDCFLCNWLFWVDQSQICQEIYLQEA